MPKKTNIRSELKKHRAEKPHRKKKKKAEPLHPFYESPQANTAAAAAAVPTPPAPPNPPSEPIPIPTTVFEPAATAVLPDGEEEGGSSSPSWAEREMEFKRKEMDRIIQLEEDRVANMLTDPNQLISPFQRIVYLNCRHRVASYINTIKLNSFYWCDTCILFRKISEIVY